jgi:hypothetical protein
MPREIINRLLTYIDAPWKAFAVALLIVVGVLTYIVFEQRAQITAAVLQGYCPACTAPSTPRSTP